MGQISSINFKKSNAIQTRHNDRDLPPSYLIGGNIEINRNSEEALKLKDQMIQEAKQTYEEKFKQKFKSTSYEWSATCNIKPDSKMEDLEKLASHFKEKYGFQCYQIAIHRDEGHIDDDGNKVINHHAHMEFVMLDKNTGKNTQRTLTPKTLRQIQTETAEILQMQRGEDKRISKRKRIEPRKYAQMKEEERKNLKKEKQKLEELEKQKLKKYKEFANEEWLAQNKFIDKLEQEKNLYKLDNEELTKELKETKQELLTQKEVNKRLEEERQKMIKEGGYTQEDYKLIRAVKEGKYVSREALEQAIAETRKSMEEKNQELETENNTLKKEINVLNDTINRRNETIQMYQKSLKHKDELIQTNLKLLADITTKPQPTTTEQTTTTRHIFTHKKKSNDIEW